MGRVILIALLLWPSLVWAGAWPRGKGAVYIDLSFYAYPQDHDTRGLTPHIYLEYGISERLTFALDGLFRNEHDMFTGIASVTTAIATKSKKLKFAYGFGYGLMPYQYQTIDELYDLINGNRILVAEETLTHTKRQSVTQFSAHAGLGLKKGWISADAYIQIFQSENIPLYKLDMTYGRNFSPKLTGHIQMQYGARGDASYLNLAPTVDWKLTPKTSLTLGANYDVMSGYHGLKLGTILQF